MELLNKSASNSDKASSMFSSTLAATRKDLMVVLAAGLVADLPLTRPPLGSSGLSDELRENDRIEVEDCGNSSPETAERAP